MSVSPGKCKGKTCTTPGRIKFVGDGLYCAGCQKKRAQRKQASTRAHAKRVETLYEITAEEYAELLASQLGACAICRRKPGKKRLSVDHDHLVETLLGKRASVRGLLCRNCNYVVLGHLGDSVEALQRAIKYLEHPPAREVLK